MLTAQVIALDCLSFIGEFSLDAFTQNAENPARNAILARIAREINASLQEIFSRRPDIYRQAQGATIHAPETQTVTATNGGTALTLGTAYAVNLDGATCSIGGRWNELRKNGDTVTLVNPYTGPTGLAAMTVFGDSILLDMATYARVLGNVNLWGNQPLTPLTNRQEFLHYNEGWCSDYGRWPARTGPTIRHLGIPQAWFAETYLAGDGLKIRLRLTPLPDREIPVTFDAEMRPGNITAADFGTDATDPGKTFSLPAQMDETLLLPLVRARWSQSPFFKDAESRAALAAAAVDARKMLSDFRAQGQRGATLQIVGYH